MDICDWGAVQNMGFFGGSGFVKRSPRLGCEVLF